MNSVPSRSPAHPLERGGDARRGPGTPAPRRWSCAPPVAAGRPAGPGRGTPASCRRQYARCSSKAGPGQMLALPGGEVRVLQGQRRQLGRLAAPGQGVQRAQLTGDDTAGPAVGDDVVQHDDEHVVVVGQPDQPHPQQRAAAQVERLPRTPSPGPGRGRPRRPECRPGSARVGRSATPRPSTVSNVVRNDSCLATSAVNACRSASTSRSPRSRTAIGVTYSVLLGSNSLRNQSRCWANESGRWPSRATCGMVPSVPPVGTAATSPSAPPFSTAAASPATVGVWNSARGDTSHAQFGAQPRGGPDAEDRVAAQLEEVVRRPPPGPRRAPRPRPSQRPARSRCAARGSWRCAAGDQSGAGRARRSSLPLRLSGSRSSSTKADGTMYSGSAPRAQSRSCGGIRCAPAAGTTYATSRLPPDRSARATTATSPTSGCAGEDGLDLAQLDPEARVS